MTAFKRIILTGSLTTLSSFHIGTGKEENNGEIQFNQLCLDNDGHPYIPASSLRGYLRKIIAQKAKSSETALFGLARQKSDAPETGNSGLVRIYDSRWNSGENNTQLISQISIDPVTATAKHHQLSTHAIIPPQSQFLLNLEIDNANEAQLKSVLQALQTFNATGQGKLGKGKSTGQGELQWKQTSLKVLTEKKLKEWLTQRPKKNKKQQPLGHYFSEMEITVAGFDAEYKKLQIKLKANSPLLINDPQAVKNKTTEIKDPLEPDLIFRQTAGHAIIPGSTLKGWARARARRILLTLLGSNPKKTADQLTEQLFGNTHSQGYLTFDDAKATINDQDKHLQTFTAIDRFTGGVKDGALYNVEAIWPENDFTGYLNQTQPLEGWMKLLLLYIIKDSMEEDLILGWGKSKGYGRLQLIQIENYNWNALYHSLNQTELSQWDKDLQQQLQGENS